MILPVIVGVLLTVMGLWYLNRTPAYAMTPYEQQRRLRLVLAS